MNKYRIPEGVIIGSPLTLHIFLFLVITCYQIGFSYSLNNTRVLCLFISAPILILVLGIRLSVSNRRFVKSLKKHLDNQFKICFTEEFVWRFIPLLILERFFLDYSILIYMCLSILFVWLHIIKQKHIHFLTILEFSLYFLLLALIYFYTKALVLAFTLHYLRNITLILLNTIKRLGKIQNHENFTLTPNVAMHQID